MKELISFLTAVIYVFSLIFSYNDVTPYRLPVIMYHHISESPELNGKYTVTPEQLESDFRFLTENGYESVTPSDISKGNLPKKGVMITFDDGFLSCRKYALPLLEKYSLRAVFAVVGKLTEQYTEEPNTLSDCAYMTADDIIGAAASGRLEFACHTYDMHSLSVRRGCAKMKNESAADYRSVLMHDLEQFGAVSERLSLPKTDIIAFPYGEYSSLTVEIAVDAGYRYMLTCEEKINEIKLGGGAYVLGRFNRDGGKSSEEALSFLL